MKKQSYRQTTTFSKWLHRQTIFFNIFSPKVSKNPYPYYSKLRNHSPVHYYRRQKSWVITKYSDVKTVLNDSETFLSSEGPELLRRSIIHQNGTAHAHLRKCLISSFTAKKILELEGSICTITQNLIDSIIAKDQDWEFVQDFAVPLPLLVVLDLIGAPLDCLPEFTKWVRAAVAQTQGSKDPEILYNTENLVKFCKDHIAQCQKNPQANNVMTQLLYHNPEEQRLTSEEAYDFLITLTMAATETTTHLLGNTLLLLLSNPDLKKQIRENSELIPTLINESLRYEPPVHHISRDTAKDIVLSGVFIPANSRVAAFIGSANRDPEQFPDPDKFILERDTKGHLGFGWGKSFCLGTHLSLLEARVAIKLILQRLPNLAMLDPRDQIQYLDSPLLRGLKYLRLTTTLK